MSDKYLKGIFDMMKGLDFMKDYKDYEDYKKKKYGDKTKTSEERTKEFREKLLPKEKESFDKFCEATEQPNLKDK